MGTPTVLIIDDERTLVESLAYGLKKRDFNPVSAFTGSEGLAKAQETAPDVVLLDLWLPDQSGLSVLQSLRKSFPELPVIVITAHGDTKTAVETMKMGAADFLLKPFELEEVAHLIQRTIDYRRMEDEVRFHRRMSLDRPEHLVCDPASAMGRLVETLMVAARSQARAILLLGESGTGKAMIAKLLHDESPRKEQPFVEVNCATIAPTLFESQLFGHEKGSFTDAKESYTGLIRMAEGGTFFLDEIGEVPLPLQPKLLQFLESQRFRPVGGRREYSVELRVVVATNRDLQAEVKEGRFRADLFYRINVVPFTVPPLRDRMEDLPPLLAHFIESAARKEGAVPIRISGEVDALFRRHDWPGNVRELKNLVERWTILHPGQTITRAEVPPEMTGDSAGGPAAVPSLGGESIEAVLDRTERSLIDQALAEARGRRGQTAERLGISRHALKRRMQRLGMGED